MGIANIERDNNMLLYRSSLNNQKRNRRSLPAFILEVLKYKEGFSLHLFCTLDYFDN